MVRTFHVPTVSICAHGLSFLSVADLSTQPGLTTDSSREALALCRWKTLVIDFVVLGFRRHCWQYLAMRVTSSDNMLLISVKDLF